MIEKKIDFEDLDVVSLFGANDEHVTMIENRFKSGLIVRGSSLVIKGEEEEIQSIEKIFNEMTYMLKRNKTLTNVDVKTIIELISNKPEEEQNYSSRFMNQIIFQGVKDAVRVRNPKQYEYYKLVQKNDLVFAIGPAGTGKTFLAVAMGLASLRNNDVSRIILSRPAVEAGESLGFLPGDLQEKIDPYLKPLMDAMHFMLSSEKVKSLIEKNVIEITPLAYMRGRTLSNSFIILDEAQNATATQMKMFLTRLGLNSKAVVTGDITQIDLPSHAISGLVEAKRLLNNIENIGFIYFDSKDVVRHKLVAEIIKAYEKDDTKRKSKDDFSDKN